MRTGRIIVAALVILTGTMATAEARFRGGRAFSSSRSVAATPIGRPVPTATGIGVGVGVPIPAYSRRNSNPAAETAPNRPVVLRPILPVTAPVPAIQAVRAEGPWCSDKRRVGAGTGFCQIN